MPQEMHVLRCYSCEAFQVHIVKKVPKWECKVCGEKQSIKKVYGKGSGKDCRQHVQQLNQKRLEIESINAERLSSNSTINTEVNTYETTSNVKSDKWVEFMTPNSEVGQVEDPPNFKNSAQNDNGLALSEPNINSPLTNCENFKTNKWAEFLTPEITTNESQEAESNDAQKLIINEDSCSVPFNFHDKKPKTKFENPEARKSSKFIFDAPLKKRKYAHGTNEYEDSASASFNLRSKKPKPKSKPNLKLMPMPTAKVADIKTKIQKCKFEEPKCTLTKLLSAVDSEKISPNLSTTGGKTSRWAEFITNSNEDDISDVADQESVDKVDDNLQNIQEQTAAAFKKGCLNKEVDVSNCTNKNNKDKTAEKKFCVFNNEEDLESIFSF